MRDHRDDREQQSGSAGAVDPTSRPGARPTPRRFALASRANERLQIDHTQLDLRVKIEGDGTWQAARPWCGVALGEFSCSVAACVLSAGQPDELTIGLLLTQAILPKNVWLNKGTPDAIQTDNGNAVTADSIAAFGAALGITVDRDPPRHPNEKSKVERWFQTLDSELLRTLPGHTKGIGSTEKVGGGRLRNLLTLPELRVEIIRWISEGYHHRVQGEPGAEPGDVPPSDGVPTGTTASSLCCPRLNVFNRGCQSRRTPRWRLRSALPETLSTGVDDESSRRR